MRMDMDNLRKMKMSFIHFIMIFLFLSFPGETLALEELSVKTIVPSPGRTVFSKPYNGDDIVITFKPYEHIRQNVDNLVVNIYARRGDYIEVTFIGNVCGNGWGEIEVRPDSATHATLKFGHYINYGWERHPHVWRPYIMKYVFQADAEGTISFGQVIDNGDWYKEHERGHELNIKLREITGFAEIIATPQLSPATS